jgi:PHAX RNA-binding domain
MGITAKQRAMKAARAAAKAANTPVTQAEASKSKQMLTPARSMPAPLVEAQPPSLEDPGSRRAVIETAAALARRLGETEYTPRLHLLRCVRVLGPERSRALLDEALRIDLDGGELLPSLGRYRTPGGIFFRLVRDLVGADVWTGSVHAVSLSAAAEQPHQKEAS